MDAEHVAKQQIGPPVRFHTSFPVLDKPLDFSIGVDIQQLEYLVAGGPVLGNQVFQA